MLQPPQDSFIFSGPHGILPDAWGFSGLLKILQVLLYALGFLGAFQASSGPPGCFSRFFRTLLGFWSFPGGSSGSLSAPRSSQDSSGPVGAHQDSSERLRVVQDSAGFSGALWSESLARMRARASAGEEVRARAPNKSDVSNACDYMTAQRGPEHKSIGLRIVPPSSFFAPFPHQAIKLPRRPHRSSIRARIRALQAPKRPSSVANLLRVRPWGRELCFFMFDALGRECILSIIILYSLPGECKILLGSFLWGPGQCSSLARFQAATGEPLEGFV